MKIFKALRLIARAKHEHFLSVDKKTYNNWKYLIRITLLLNKNYKSCEIYRKKFKSIDNFVVIGLKYNGKNVKRRTSGYAKEFIEEHKNSTCLYCGEPLDIENVTTDHIVPISKGGTNCQVNMIVCCKTCNSERGNIEFKEYLYMKNPKYKNQKIFF